MKKLVSILALTLAAPLAFAVSKGDTAPAVDLPGLTKKGKISLSSYKGKVVYLDFWASWCGPCRTSLPMLNKMYKEFGNDKFEILAINLDEEKKDAMAFLKDYPVSYPTLADPQGRTPELYKIKGMPTSFIIDQKGKVVDVHEGFVKKDIKEIRAKISKLISKK